jgi:hypothetical protein
VKALPAELLDTQPGIPWRQIARMRDHLAHRLPRWTQCTQGRCADPGGPDPGGTGRARPSRPILR